MLLFCFLEGEKASFPIEVAENQSVGALQIAIKVEKWDSLGHIPTNKVILYQVNILEEEAAIEAAFQAITPKNQEPLRPSFRLSRYFTEDPEGGKIHILIRLSPRESRDRHCPVGVTSLKRVAAPVVTPIIGPPAGTTTRPGPAIQAEGSLRMTHSIGNSIYSRVWCHH